MMISHWQKITLGPQDTIRDALVIINSDLRLKLAIIVNDAKELVGVVTDGDIRRALLSNYTLDSAIETIMNSCPVTVSCNTPKKEIASLMERKGIASIPVIEKGVLVGIETYQEVTLPQTYENPIFIMAGGFGTRLRPLTDNCPKPLLEVGGRPLLETILLSFKDAGFKNFYISIHYLPEMIRNYFGDGSKWDVNISYVYESTPLGTGGALGLLPNDMPDLPIILINGDILTTVNFQNLLEFHIKNNAAATMCVRDYIYNVPYGVIKGDGKNILSIEEKPLHSFFVNAGIYIIEQEIARSVIKNQYIDIPTLLEQRINESDDVLMFPIHEYWLDIGSHDDLKKAQLDITALGI